MKKLNLDDFHDIPDTNGRYKIHMDGRVYSTISNKVLTHLIKTNGRHYVSLHFMTKPSRQYDVARLLADTFIPNPYGCKYVVLRDGDPHNLSLSNIEWTNYKYHHNGGKYIVGYNKKYKIYRDGRVFNMRTRSYLTHSHSKSGDIRVTLRDDNGKPKQYSLSTLLYTHFIGYLSNEKKVVHKDGDRSNIALENLTYTFKGKKIPR